MNKNEAWARLGGSLGAFAAIIVHGGDEQIGQDAVLEDAEAYAAVCVAKALADPLALIRDLLFWATHTPTQGEYKKRREVFDRAAALLAGTGDEHDEG